MLKNCYTCKRNFEYCSNFDTSKNWINNNIDKFGAPKQDSDNCPDWKEKEEECQKE